MSRFEKKLDNYYTKKLIKKIRDKLYAFYIDLIFEEDVDIEGNERILIKINLRGKKELKKPIYIMSFYKNQSVDLFFNNYFCEVIRRRVEIELENI